MSYFLLQYYSTYPSLFNVIFFEASMSKARRSVSPEVVQQYDEFTAKIKQQWDTESTGSSTYDYDKASAEQAREDSLIEAGAA